MKTTSATENGTIPAINGEEEESPSPVHLGFIETIHDEEQLRRIAHRSANFDDWDGGQVGGCPSFLDPVHVPDALECPQCQHANMNFICQLYAPVDEYEERAFHRSLYVFACSQCQDDSTRSVRVLRCQLPQQNPYFPADSSCVNITNNWDRHLPATHNVPLCQVCGMRGKYKCPLQQLYFCGKQHQKEYKKHVFDKIKNGSEPSEFLPSVYPIAELAVDAEVPATANDDDDDQQRETMFQSSKEGDDDDSDAELEQDDLNRMTGKKGTANEQDQYTQTFMQRIKRQPDQSLRYARWRVGHAAADGDDSSEDDKVLWIRKDYLPSQIPDCPYCGAPRRFEFQLMPQMLDHLNQNSAADASAAETYQQYKTALQQAEDLIRQAPPESIPPALVENKERAAARMREYLLKQRKSSVEFGVVAVYTCVQSCGTTLLPTSNNGACEDEGAVTYREEYAWRQPCLDLS